MCVMKKTNNKEGRNTCYFCNNYSNPIKKRQCESESEKMRTLLIVVLLLYFVSSTLADIPTLFSLCSRQNHSKWVRHKPRQFNFVKAWIRSLHLNNNRCPSKGFKVLTHYYENEEEYAVDLITQIDDITGRYLPYKNVHKCKKTMNLILTSFHIQENMLEMVGKLLITMKMKNLTIQVTSMDQ